eukprot:jgi/Tetstr1/445594/TSEL_003400.t1
MYRGGVPTPQLAQPQPTWAKRAGMHNPFGVRALTVEAEVVPTGSGKKRLDSRGTYRTTVAVVASNGLMFSESWQNSAN